jgi:hypothetical protein
MIDWVILIDRLAIGFMPQNAALLSMDCRIPGGHSGERLRGNAETLVQARL